MIFEYLDILVGYEWVFGLLLSIVLALVIVLVARLDEKGFVFMFLIFSSFSFYAGLFELWMYTVILILSISVFIILIYKGGFSNVNN